MVDQCRFLGLSDFPIRVMGPVGTVSHYVCGKPRIDGACLLYIPARPPLVPLAHWTIAVGGQSYDYADPAALGGVVLYSDIPPISYNPHVFWHAGSCKSATLQFWMRAGNGCRCKRFCRHQFMWEYNHELANRGLPAGTGPVAFMLSCRIHPRKLYNPRTVRFGSGRPGQYVAHILRCPYSDYDVRISNCTTVQIVTSRGIVYSQNKATSMEFLNKTHLCVPTGEFMQWGGVALELLRIEPQPVISFTPSPRTRGRFYLVVGVAKAVSSMFSRNPLVRYHVTYRRFASASTFCAIGVAGALMFELRSIARSLFNMRSQQRFFPMQVEYDVATFAPYNIQLPFEQELFMRMAVKRDITDAWIRDVITRLAHQNDWRGVLNRHELNQWISRVVTEPGLVWEVQKDGLRNNACYTCLSIGRKMRRNECAQCRTQRNLSPLYFTPIPYTPFAHVGLVGIYSRPPLLPPATYYHSCEERYLPYKSGGWYPGRPFEFIYHCSYKGKIVNDPETAYAIYNSFGPQPRCRGKLCGPMLAGAHMQCFTSGTETALLAFVGRMGAVSPEYQHYLSLGVNHSVYNDIAKVNARHKFDYLLEIFKHVGAAAYYDGDNDAGGLRSKYIPSREVVPWTPQQVIDHQPDSAKRRIMIEAYRDIDEGFLTPTPKLYKAKAIAKGEKSMAWDHDISETLIYKSKQVPRFISACSPHTNALIAPYIAAAEEFVKEFCSSSASVAYASGMNPEQLNEWLNTYAVDRLIIEGDISSADSAIGVEAHYLFFYFLTWLFPELPESDVWHVIQALSYIYVDRDGSKFVAGPVNVSGSRYTSCIVTIWVMVANVTSSAFSCLSDYRTLSQADRIGMVKGLLQSGNAATITCSDDIYTAVNTSFSEWHFMRNISPYLRAYTYECSVDSAWLRRFCDTMRTEFFLDVRPNKCRLFPAAEWRLATFLAMRPVWSGSRYEWGPEICRRMRSAYWMFDKEHPPMAWGRGISAALLVAGRHVPVLRDICTWHLSVTHGPIMKLPFTNIWSTFYRYEVSGEFTDRGLNEFLADYDISTSEYLDFVDKLKGCMDPFINIQHSVIQKLLMRE
ncbi:RNA-dependent RNA polymerase [Wenzhou yanvirus-like virus 1]|uniref:RNA-dependent RNA polymerase n=1 Tax=Wenzhou yanvirus-like virus 1 TaxID=1923683 RepID=UPI00090B4051|nr:RNA-dependent RNA polymerase [Wenzhou yanvirus-like virus 1]APG78137.1 RNA-dependent RNA polymerase [Wenzhou yanvirus-like virus 1]